MLSIDGIGIGYKPALLLKSGVDAFNLSTCCIHIPIHLDSCLTVSQIVEESVIPIGFDPSPQWRQGHFARIVWLSVQYPRHDEEGKDRNTFPDGGRRNSQGILKITPSQLPTGIEHKGRVIECAEEGEEL